MSPDCQSKNALDGRESSEQIAEKTTILFIDGKMKEVTMTEFEKLGKPIMWEGNGRCVRLRKEYKNGLSLAAVTQAETNAAAKTPRIASRSRRANDSKTTNNASLKRPQKKPRLEVESPATVENSSTEAEDFVDPQPTSTLSADARFIFEGGVAYLGQNIEFDSFLKTASHMFKAGLMDLMQQFQTVCDKPKSPLKVANWNFEPLFIKSSDDNRQYQMFQYGNNLDPFDEKLIHRTIIEKVLNFKDDFKCGWNGCTCENGERFIGKSKNDVKVHILRNNFAYVCNSCLKALAIKGTFTRHTWFCVSNKDDIKKSYKYLPIAIPDEELVNQEMEDFEFKLLEQFCLTFNVPEEELTEEAKIFMACKTFVQRQNNAQARVTKINNLVHIKKYYLLKKNMPFCIYNLQTRETTDILDFYKIISSYRIIGDQCICNYDDCEACIDERFKSDAPGIKMHLKANFRLTCPSCRMGYLSLSDLEAHYSEACLTMEIDKQIRERRNQQEDEPVDAD